MRSLKSLAVVVVFLTCQAVAAQPAPPPGGPGGGGRGFGQDRGFGGDRRQGGGRDQFIRHEEPRQGSFAPAREPGVDPSGRGNLSPDERRALRDQIRDHGRELYKAP